MPLSEQDERQAQTLPRLRLFTRMQVLTVGVALVTAAWMLRPPESAPLTAATEAAPPKVQALDQATDRTPVGTIAPMESTATGIREADPRR